MFLNGYKADPEFGWLFFFRETLCSSLLADGIVTPKKYCYETTIENGIVADSYYPNNSLTQLDLFQKTDSTADFVLAKSDVTEV